MNPGDLIDQRFEIAQLVGAGGMGAVYRARDVRLEEPVALKVLLGAPLQERQLRFEREALALAELRHPGIVRYVAHGATPDGLPYLVMEWIEGEDLGVRLARGPLSLDETLTLGVRVAEAAGAAHARGVVHRDLKPSNLLLAGKLLEAPKVADFGVALFPGAARATRSGAVIGTPAYMAPEQARGERGLSPRADVFALGCILHECLASTPAFPGDDVMAVLTRIVFEEVPRLRELGLDVPAPVEDLVAAMLAKDPAARPADGAAVAAALAAIRADIAGTGGELPARPPGPRERPALTGHERRLSCIVLASRSTGASADPMASTVVASDARLPPPPRAAIQSIEARGGSPVVLADGTIAVTVPSALLATDHAALAAGCALSLRAALPTWAVAIATGRGDLAALRPLGEAIEHAARTIRERWRASGPALPVDIDGVTAGLLDLRFDVVAGDLGLELRGERYVAEAPRTLLGRPTLFAGREREMAALEALFAECVDDPSARAVLVTGPAGSGKSRLRHELVERLRSRGVEPWIARGDPTRAGAPFGMLAPLISRAARLLDGEPIEIRREKLLRRVARHVAASEHALRAAEFLGEVVGTPFPDEGRVELRAARRDPRLLGDQMRRAWVSFVDAECRARPLVIVLEDLHWGDQPSAEYVDAALRLLQARPLLVLGLARPEVHDRLPRLWHDRQAQEIRLGPLARRAAERIVVQALGAGATPETCAALCERSAGNAFFLEELVRATAEGHGADLPETMLAMVESRLDALDSEDRRLLRAAAVFGEVFWCGGLSALLGDRQRREDRLDRLERQEWITRRRDAKFRGEEEYAFRHGIVRDAAYGTLTGEDRALGHRLAGTWLVDAGETDALVLAQHFEHGGELAGAVRWYRRAAEQALEGDDLGSAIDHVARAVTLGASGEVLGELALVSARAYNWRGEHAEAERWATRAVEALPPGAAHWCAAVRETFRAMSVRPGFERLVGLGEALRAVARESAITSEIVIAMATAAYTLFFLGQYDQAQALGEETQQLAAAFGDEPSVAATLLKMHALRAGFAGDPTLARDLHVAAVAKHEEAGDMREACMLRCNAAGACNDLGGHEDAAALARTALADAERQGLHLAAAFARMNLGHALVRLGALAEARAVLEKAIGDCIAGDQRRLEGGCRVYLATALRLGGDLPAAEEEARRAVTVFTDFRASLPAAVATLADVLLSVERVTEAMERAGEAFELLESLGMIEEGEALVRVVYAEALHASGRREEALAAVAAARDQILSRAARIADETRRRTFLERVPEHVRTLERARTWLGTET